MQSLSPDSDTFDFYSVRFEFRVLDQLVFPRLLSSNIFRGALGLTLRRTSPSTYRHLLAPERAPGRPSGLADPPRPIVFRTRHVDGRTFNPGDVFEIYLNLLDSNSDFVPHLADALLEMGRSGFGSQRSRAELISYPGQIRRCSLPLCPGRSAQHVRVEFLTPTELKSGGSVINTPRFDVLLRRARDRISDLRSLYGAGPLGVRFDALTENSSAIRLTLNQTQYVQVARRSSRTKQVHPLGGLVGVAEYTGELSEFLPYLNIAAHTGVGRQTVWGKGEIATQILS